MHTIEESAVGSEKVTLRHPHTGDIKQVEATPAAMVPLMCLGYVQHSPATPAQGE